MVDNEPGSYRPRRAHPQEPAEPEAPQTPTQLGSPPSSVFDEDAPKPLYRDEVAGTPSSSAETAATSTAPWAAPSGADDDTRIRGAADGAPPTSEQTQILSRARARARAKSGARPGERRARDEDATTILPRTATGSRMRRSEEEALDDDERVPPGQRSRIGLLIGAVVGVVVLGLAIGYTVLSLTRPSAAPGVAPSDPGTSSGPTTGTSSSPPEPEPSALLTDASLITPQSAAKIDSERTWKVQLDSEGPVGQLPAAGLSGWRSGGGTAHSAAEHAARAHQHGQESAGRAPAGGCVRQPGGGGPGLRGRSADARWLHDGRHLHRLRGAGHRTRRPVSGGRVHGHRRDRPGVPHRDLDQDRPRRGRRRCGAARGGGRGGQGGPRRGRRRQRPVPDRRRHLRPRGPDQARPATGRRGRTRLPGHGGPATGGHAADGLGR